MDIVISQTPYSAGNPRDQITKFVSVFSPASDMIFFRISRFKPDGICSNKAQSPWKIKLFLVV